MENSNYSCNGSKAVSPVFQLILILINALAITAMLSYRIRHSRVHEPPPAHFHATSADTDPKIQAVRAGLHIDHFETFDTKASDFTFFGTVWFETAPHQPTLDRLGRFNFESGTILDQRPATISVVGDKVIAQYAIKARITRPMDHRLFPIDSHRLYFGVANHDFSSDELQFSSSTSDFSADVPLAMFGWQKVNEQVACGVKRIVIDEHDMTNVIEYPVALFSIDIVRSGVQYLLLILLPLLFIFYLALFTLSASAQTAGITASVMVAIPGYRIVVQSLVPSAGYLVLSDYLFFIFLAAAGSVFLVSIITSASPSLTARHRQYAIVAIHLAVLTACGYLLAIA